MHLTVGTFCWLQAVRRRQVYGHSDQASKGCEGSVTVPPALPPMRGVLAVLPHREKRLGRTSPRQGLRKRPTRGRPVGSSAGRQVRKIAGECDLPPIEPLTYRFVPTCGPIFETGPVRAGRLERSLPAPPVFAVLRVLLAWLCVYDALAGVLRLRRRDRSGRDTGDTRQRPLSHTSRGFLASRSSERRSQESRCEATSPASSVLQPGTDHRLQSL